MSLLKFPLLVMPTRGLISRTFLPVSFKFSLTCDADARTRRPQYWLKGLLPACDAARTRRPQYWLKLLTIHVDINHDSYYEPTIKMLARKKSRAKHGFSVRKF